MDLIKQTLFTGWHFMRWLRLAFGIFLLVQAIQINDMLIGVASGFFLLTAITNIGCCGARSCAVPQEKDVKGEHERTKTQ